MRNVTEYAIIYVEVVFYMYLRKKKFKTSGRIHLSILHGFRDNEGKVKQKTVMKIGYLDEMEKIYNNPIAHFEALAEKMSEERNVEKAISITLDMEEEIDPKQVYRKNYGYIVFSIIYHELEINRFLDNARRHKKFEFNSEAIMRLLVYSRLLYPGSKRETVLNKDIFFDGFNCSLDDVYDSLTHFNTISEDLQQHLHEQVSKQYGRETNLVYYDVTNYFFEIDREDEFRKKGPSKEHRRDPIVQMGLLLDKVGLPISYKIFPGNTHDSQTLMPMLTNVKKRFGVNRIIAVADKGLNSGDNIAYNTLLGDGYIYSKSVRGASKEFKEWVLDEAGYRKIEDGRILKSKVVPDAVINVTVEQIGKKKIKKKETVEQKWVAIYSEKYAKRAKHKRDEAIAKAIKLIENPSKYRRTFDYGAAGYIENIKIDKDTGEIENIEDKLILNYDKIREEEMYDGYYAIVSSELDDTDVHIHDMYRGLWRIEESFKVTKSILETRPIYLKTFEHINAHFLTCFISLLIARCVEISLGNKYTIEKITETLRKVACSNINQNIWTFNFANDITADINAVFDTNIGKRNMTLKEIKNNLSKSKKR